VPIEEDRNELAMFLTTVHEDLHTVVHLRRDLFLLEGADIPTLAEIVDVMPGAWDEVQTRITNPNIVEEMYQLSPADLEGVGLTGRQLTLKLLAWSRTRDLLLTEFENSDDAQPRPVVTPPPLLRGNLVNRFRRLVAKRPRVLRRALRHMTKTLRNADIVLGSLSTILPGIDVLSEFKEVIENLATDKSEDPNAK
jgi:hypothetical protein